ncbi:MAG: PLP-dependent aminotransferase family protein [Bacillota bacterium]
MRIPLDPETGEPLYQQIQAYLRQSILSGSLLPGTRLPASRQLAHELGVSRITVENAYAELEAAGLVTRRLGSGTYVLPPWPAPPRSEEGRGAPWPSWQRALTGGEEAREPVAPEEMLRACGHPDPISFAGGSGDPRLYPVEDLRRTIRSVLRRDGIAALGYGDPSGYAPLRQTIASVLASQGLEARPENILITSGAQQGLALVSQILLRPGDTIVVESPTYARALELFRALGLRLVGVPIDEDGMQVDHLEELLQQHHPRLIYTIPNFHNPTGTCLSGHRRRQLVALADRYNVPILEDDFAGDLRYEGSALPALKALDPGGRVIYVSTFSKMLMPGLRVGFVVAEGPVGRSLVSFKRAYDLSTSALIQRVVEEYVTVGRYQAHLRRSRRIYRQRRDAMMQAIGRCLPAVMAIRPPQGGFFIWLRLPGELSAERLLLLACREGVAFTPGRGFFPTGDGGENYLRLNFAAQEPSEIGEGIRRLAAALKVAD